jgi:type II secretory pathway component PulK
MRRKLPKPLVPQKKREPRRGIVLLAVLVSLVLLSLAAYQYADLMMSEYRAAYNAHRSIQAKLLADSGVHYVAAMLSSSDMVNNSLNGNFWNNSQYFFDIPVPTADGDANFGKFTLIAPYNSDAQNTSQGVRYGATDESSKINLNVMMQLDPTGTQLYNMLMLLPNMTSPIANSIIDWLDADSTTRDGGAEDDYYMSLPTPYHCKNGPLESIEELLMVQGVTPQLLFGNDLNRNGIIEPSEDDGSGPFAFGWSAFLTVYSRESNNDVTGTPYLYLNNPDIQTLYTNMLAANVPEDMATFIILYRQYGGTSTTKTAAAKQLSTTATTAAANAAGDMAPTIIQSSTTTSSSTTASTTTTTQSTGDLGSVTIDFTVAAAGQILSIWELVGATVTVPGTGGAAAATYASPATDPNNQPTYLPILFSTCTPGGNNEIPARININTAPPEVLATFFQLTLDQVQAIISTRPDLSSDQPPDPTYQTPAWLLTQMQPPLDPATLMTLDPFITTNSQVFRVQSVGYFDDDGPTARVEAIIDTNGGRPRIVMWRDLTPLGKGWTKPK